jgi:hypothetical protein
MDLNVDDLNDMLLDASQEFLWRQGFLCPCRTTDSGMAALGCPQCASKGVIWGDPVPAWAAAAGMKATRQWAAFGMWMEGDMVLAIPSDSPFYECGEKDRVLMTGSSEPFKKVLTRGRDMGLFTTLSVERVYWLTSDLKTRIEGSIPPVDANGAFSFDGLPVAPEPGQQYSITGRLRPEFYIFQDLPQDREHFRGLKLPRKVVLRRFDLFGRGGNLS